MVSRGGAEDAGNKPAKPPRSPRLRVNRSHQNEPHTPPLPRAPERAEIQLMDPNQAGRPRNTRKTRNRTESDRRSFNPRSCKRQRVAGLVKRKKGFMRRRGGRGEHARQTSALSAPPREPVWPSRTGYSVDPTGTGGRRSFSSELQAASQPGKSRPVKPRNTPNTRKPRAMKSGSIR